MGGGSFAAPCASGEDCPLLGCDERYLWPETDDDPRCAAATRAELVAVYPNRGSVSIGTWTSLADRAMESIDVLAYSASFLHDAIPDFDSVLADKARDGDLLAARCRLTWSYLRPVLQTSGVQARKHDCSVYNSIFRFDDTLLVNTHVFGAPASQSPVIHLQRVAGGRLFATDLAGFE